ncbi:retrotransposon protein putative unclassified, partial [Trifolium medium]|nr:retrotransposon protein putative unclassified [Trifolium medium]
MTGQMLKWSLELAEFEILYESRKSLKAQVLVDFVAEMTTPTTPEKKQVDHLRRWILKFP